MAINQEIWLHFTVIKPLKTEISLIICLFCLSLVALGFLSCVCLIQQEIYQPLSKQLGKI